MRLEKKKDEEIAARKGMTGKTIIAFIWLTISGVIAFFLIKYMFDTDVLRYRTFYNMGIPNSVPQWVILGALIIIVVVIMQTFLMLGFMLASPEGRRRTGDPTLHSHRKEPFDDYGGRG
jgi:ABC-type sugar transport system permease subunit